ncbi:MAG: Mu transposase domain-containing protein [Methylococcales bacterium]
MDKTSLISRQSNKYSVPMGYQCATVAVISEAGRPVISAIGSGEVIAEHRISLEKGRILKIPILIGISINVSRN